jgi:hypothetical protein
VQRLVVSGCHQNHHRRDDGQVTVEKTSVLATETGGGGFTAADLVERWPWARPFTLLGAACIVAGGVVAAVARPASFGYGSWTAAFLVLVLGVAQLALGGGQAWIAADVPDRRFVMGELIGWNLGGALVIIGTLTSLPALTSVGGVVEALALVLFLIGVRHASSAPRWARLVFRTVVAVMAVSIPIGLVLAWIHPSS